MINSNDTIVLGLGAMGSAAAYQLAKRGNKVLGIDQFDPPHNFGSSHGDTRIIRQAIGEGREYMPLVLRSYELWKEIEQETGKRLLTITGGLIMTSIKDARHHGSNFFQQTVDSAREFNIAHSILDSDHIRKLFPQFKLQGKERGYYEENAGFLYPELCIEAQLELAEKCGAQLVVNEKVISFSPATTKDKVVVRTTKGEYEAAKVIISAGPWISQLLAKELSQYFTVYPQIAYWFSIEGLISNFALPNFPVWIWEFGANEEDVIYGFPAIDGFNGGIKIVSEQYSTKLDPNTVSREVTKQETQYMYKRYVQPHFIGVGKECVKTVPCLYTVTPDHKFIIDTHPKFPQVIIASPCSGHGFKHSAAIGEVLAELAIEGRSSIDISKFSFRRLGL